MSEFAEDVATVQQDSHASPQQRQRRSSQPQDVDGINKDITATPVTSNLTNGKGAETSSNIKVPKSASPAATTAPRHRNARGTATGRQRTRKDVSEHGDDDEYRTSSSSPRQKRTKKTNTAIGTAKLTATKRKNAPTVAAPTRTLRPRTSNSVVAQCREL